MFTRRSRGSESMEMLLVSGSSRISICVSERPGSPGVLDLSEPMSRMFMGLWGRAATTSALASCTAFCCSDVVAALPVVSPPKSLTRPLA